MGVNDAKSHPHLTTELALIDDAIGQDMPVLGVCLGAQLIAKTLGARVTRNKEKEIGWYDVAKTEEAKEDPVVGPFRASEKIFQWHGDTFQIPRGAVRLAGSQACANQAFRFGEKVYGFQFHLEVDEPLIERWLETPGFKKEIDGLKGKVSVEAIRRETKSHVRRLSELSRKCFGAFIGLFGGRSKYQRLPSR